ncbi:MAG: hypothetical protein R3C18_14675 [Planctomycetaceae bacterium]
MHENHWSTLAAKAALIFLLVVGRVRAEDSTTWRVTSELAEAFQRAVSVEAPKDLKIVDSQNSLRLRYHCREYVVYGVLRPGYVSSYPNIRTGPMHDGIDVQLTWKDSSAEYLAKGGMDGGAHFGQVRATCYWREYVNLWRLPNESGVLELKCQFGEKIDLEVLSTLRKELSQLGEEVFEARPNWWTENYDDLRKKVGKVIKEKQPLAVSAEGKSALHWEYDTREYRVHTVDSEGTFAENAHADIGPGPRGFIIRLTSHDAELLGGDRPLTGLSAGPFYRHYFQVGGIGGGYRLDVYYGLLADKELLKSVVDAVNEFSTPASRF